MTELIQTDIQDRVMTIRFNRPDRKNALTIAMYEAINDALAQAADDPEVRVVLFRGDENCFTAGNDLVDFMQRPPNGMDSPVFRFIRSLPQFEKPIVAAIAGPAVGIGVTMLLHCDLVYAATNSVLRMPFVSLGVVPEAGSTMLLPEMLGHTRAAELMLLAEPFDAGKAYDFGLVTGVCEPDQLLATATQAAIKLAAQPPAAVRLTKAMLRQHHGEALQQTIAYEAAEFGKRLASPEAREAMTAFMEKREPDFSEFD